LLSLLKKVSQDFFSRKNRKKAKKIHHQGSKKIEQTSFLEVIAHIILFFITETVRKWPTS